ncbi:MAG: PAS domain S-box protein [Bacteroidetes bacterium]|nr:PAS domain S-box protein [Bacteroidota bacterium]MBS1980408.1 PAS domain S-box protein [Bacteroidota bacterium]
MQKNISTIFSTAYQEIFQSMSEGIIMVDDKGIMAAANPVAELFFGYEKNEMNGKHIETLLPERFRKGHAGMRLHFLADPKPRRMGVGRDLLGLRKDGSEFPIEISLSYFHIQNAVMVMAFVSDISQRKKTEDALKRSEEQLIVYAAELEKRVEMRTQALNKSVLTLENEIKERKKAEDETKRSLEKERELNELKTKFVSIASHEFRTPLSTILSSASLIQQYKERGELEKIEKHIQRVKSSVNHLTAILNDFLSLGKLDEGKVEVHYETIEVQPFLQETIEELLATLKEGQKISLLAESKLKEVKTDPRILRNILFNLISNASKYSEPGKPIVVQHLNDPTFLHISVIDEGIGIINADQKHLFDRFYRASNAGNVQGTGLGLNIVKRYVDLLNGKISFMSEYGVGSTFTISLPLTK